MSRDIKYIGLDVHKEAIVIATLNSIGQLVMESILETKASSILQFIHGLRGELHVTLEEGTWATWLYDLLKTHVLEVLVCDPRRNALLKEGNKSDNVDARKLADLLRTGMLRPQAAVRWAISFLRHLAKIIKINESCASTAALRNVHFCAVAKRKRNVKKKFLLNRPTPQPPSPARNITSQDPLRSGLAQWNSRRAAQSPEWH